MTTLQGLIIPTQWDCALQTTAESICLTWLKENGNWLEKRTAASRMKEQVERECEKTWAWVTQDATTSLLALENESRYLHKWTFHGMETTRGGVGWDTESRGTYKNGTRELGRGLNSTCYEAESGTPEETRVSAFDSVSARWPG